MATPNMIDEFKINDEIYDLHDNRIDSLSDIYAPRMLEVDKRGLESGDYNKEQYDAFRAKYPNRVYLEKYNKYSDGSEVERIYNKVALTAYPDPPEDFDEGDKGYMLESVPTRCGGGFPDSATAYQRGHIRVPALSIDEFPTEDDARSFAITRTYADSAIIRHNIRKTIKKADTLDDKCICVNTTNNINSNLSIYSDNANSKYSIFKCSLWCDFSNSPSGSFEITLYDNSGNIMFYVIIFPHTIGRSYLSRPGGKRVYFDAKVHMPYGQWSNIYIEYNATTGSPYAKLYINEELVATLDGTNTDIGTTSNPIYMTVTNSRDLVGKVALANIAFLTANSATALTSDNYFDLDNYTEIPTSDSSTGKKIIRSATADVWSIAECEDFTDDDGYVVVNKKYLRKMLVNAGGGGGKIYKHRVAFCAYRGGMTDAAEGAFIYYSSSNDPITIDNIRSKANVVEDARMLPTSQIGIDGNFYQILAFKFFGNGQKVSVMYGKDPSASYYGYVDIPLTEFSAESSYITDTVTEV